MISILEFGAVPGSDGVQTNAIQCAINACAEKGGGLVNVPAGLYLTGTIELPSHVTLHLESGAVLKGSAEMADYPEVAGGFVDAIGQKRNRCLLYARNAVNVAITGKGTIDGSGGAYAYCQDGRPFLLRFVDCKDIEVSGITLKDSPGWVSHYLGCENVLIHGITIHSHVNGNNDGIDIDACRRVRILGCDLDTADDAVCIKSTRGTPCEHIVVSGCVIRSLCGAFKLGTESAGDFRNIIMSDCVIRDTEGGGVKIISMDGSRVENIQVNNIIMDNVAGPIFVRLGRRMRKYVDGQPDRQVGIIRNVSLRNITMRVWEKGKPLYGKLPNRAGIIVTGIPGHYVEDLVFENIESVFPGGGTRAEAEHHDIPEQEGEYPEFHCFQPLPAWGMYIRHARNIRLREVRLRTRTAEMRPALFTDDVERLRLDGVEIGDEPMEAWDWVRRNAAPADGLRGREGTLQSL